jgi:hypothetical protein
MGGPASVSSRLVHSRCYYDTIKLKGKVGGLFLVGSHHDEQTDCVKEWGETRVGPCLVAFPTAISRTVDVCQGRSIVLGSFSLKGRVVRSLF